MGKLIKEHLLQHKNRAKYGDYLFATLANELNISKRLLYRTVQFYEFYPTIVDPDPQFTWNHYKILLTVKDEEKRHEYERAVLKKKLGKRELRELVYNDKQNTQNRDNAALPCTRGFPGIYKVKHITNGKTPIPCIDLTRRNGIQNLKGMNKLPRLI